MIVDVPLSTITCTECHPYLVGCFTDNDIARVFDIKFAIGLDPVYDKEGYIAGVIVVPLGVYTSEEMNKLDVVVSTPIIIIGPYQYLSGNDTQ